MLRPHDAYLTEPRIFQMPPLRCEIQGQLYDHAHTRQWDCVLLGLPEENDGMEWLQAAVVFVSARGPTCSDTSGATTGASASRLRGSRGR